MNNSERQFIEIIQKDFKDKTPAQIIGLLQRFHGYGRCNSWAWNDIENIVIGATTPNYIQGKLKGFE